MKTWWLVYEFFSFSQKPGHKYGLSTYQASEASMKVIHKNNYFSLRQDAIDRLKCLNNLDVIQHILDS